MSPKDAIRGMNIILSSTKECANQGTCQCTASVDFDVKSNPVIMQRIAEKKRDVDVKEMA